MDHRRSAINMMTGDLSVFVVVFVLSVALYTTNTEAFSYGYPGDATPARACGDHLAEMLSLVCKDRGYNIAFTPHDKYGTRYRRGIVDECCHTTCSYRTLEQYCGPLPTEATDSSSIRKRSDSDKQWLLATDEESTSKGQPFVPTSFRQFFREGSTSRRSAEGEVRNTLDRKREFPYNSVFPVFHGRRKTARGHEAKELEGDKKENHIFLKDYLLEGLRSFDLKDDVDKKVVPAPPKCNSLDCSGQIDKDLTWGDLSSQIPSQDSPKAKHPSEEKTNEGRSVFSSKVGTVSPYFMRKVLVHPHHLRLSLDRPQLAP